MALKAEVWVETVAEGGRRFMAAWRKEEEDAARHRQEKREAMRLGKLQSRKRRILRSDTHWPNRRVVGILVRTRDGPRSPACVTPTCVAPRHVDAWRDFLLGNGQKRELPVLFGQKRMYPKTIAAESVVGRI